MTGLAEVWVYLAREPLAALTATLAAWLLALRLQRALGRHPLANPVLFAVALLAGALLAGGVEYRAYFEGAQFVHFLLGPATVALAVPLYRQWQVVRRSGRWCWTWCACGTGGRGGSRSAPPRTGSARRGPCP
jgi:putative effector of murein hydrolase